MFTPESTRPQIICLSEALRTRQGNELRIQESHIRRKSGDFFAEENLTKGPPIIVSGGVELEIPVVDPENISLSDAGPVIDAYPEQTATEFLRGEVEWISPGLPVDGNILRSLADFYFSAWKRTELALHRSGVTALPLGIGYYPDNTQSVDEQLALMCQRKERYAQIYASLVNRNGPRFFRGLNMEGDLVRVDTDGGPYVPGLSFSEHINLVSNRPGAVANAAAIMAASLILVSASSPFVRSGYSDIVRQPENEVIGWNCTRWPMWHMMGKSPFGIGNYYEDNGLEAALTWSKFLLLNGEGIVPYDEEIFGNHPLGVTHYCSSTMWMKTDRLRHAWDKKRKRVMLRNENRTPDTQLSAHDSVAVFAYVLGLTQALIEHLEKNDANYYMPYHVAQTSARDVALKGNSATVWMGKDTTVHDLTKHVFLPMAQRGLDSLGIPTEESSFFLQSIKGRCEIGNGSAFLYRCFKELAEQGSWRSRGDCVLEVLRRLVTRQSGQKHPFEETGFLHWKLV